MKQIIRIFKLVCVCTLLFSCVQPINTKAEEGEPIETPSVEVTPTSEIIPTVETSLESDNSDGQQVEETEDVIPEETEDVVPEETENIDILPDDEYELTPPLFYDGTIAEDYDVETLDNDPNDIMLMSTEDDEYLAPYKKAVEDALAKINLGSLGFFQSINATDAQSILKGTYSNTNLILASANVDYATAIQHTSIGTTGDATSMENVLEALNTIKKINEIRVQEGLSEFQVTSTMMAMSEVQNNASAYTPNGYYHTETFRVGENLAKVHGINGAIDGWYTQEKVNYETNNGGQTGHYENIVSASTTITGAAVTQNGMNGWTSYEQSFGGSYADNYSGDTKYSTTDYYNMFMTYYNDVYDEYNTAVANLEQAQQEIWAKDLVVSTSYETTTYNFAVQKPKVLSVISNGTKMIEGVDYKVVYDDANSINVGEYSLQIVGIGDNSGSITKTYTITPANMSSYTATLSATSFTYNGSIQKPTITSVKYGTKVLQSSDYTVSYSNNSSTNKGTYNITITGKGNYTGSITKSYSIIETSLSSAVVTLSNNSFEYDGNIQKPTVTSVTLGGKTLTNDVDYTVSYSNASSTKVGSYSITINGAANYSGSVTKTYTITKYNLSSATVTLSDTSFEYSGSVQKPAITSVTLGGKTLTSGVDYTATYNDSNSKNVGNYSITINGIGDYEGTISKAYVINSKDISDADYEYTPYSSYDGNPWMPDSFDPPITINGITLIENKDYVLEYKPTEENPTIPAEVGGPYYFIIRGIGNYTGSITESYGIIASPISGATIDYNDTYTYTGSAIIPNVVVKKGDKILIEGKDYTVTASKNVDAGIARLTIAGINNYGYGSPAFREFTINPASIENAVISDIPTQVYENGVPVTPTPTVTLNGKALVKDIDYELVYSDNTAGGTGTVTVKGKGNYTDSVSKKFTIMLVLDSIVINNGTTLSLENGQTKQLSLTYTPSEYVDKNVTYSSNNNGVATVSSTGLIKAIKSGTATITVTSVSKPTVKTSVTVTVTSPCAQLLFTNNKTSLTENYSTGDTKTIGYLAALSDGTAPTVSATSSDNSVATVTINNTNKTFTINAVKAGKATISITCGKKTITYIANVYSVSPSEKLVMETEGYETLGIEPGKTTQLNIYTSSDGTNTINDKIIYTSSDPSIATVDENGVITAIKSGTVTITATIKDDPLNRKVTQSIKVIAPQTDEITVGVTDENGNDISGTITQEPATAEEDLRLYIDWDDIYRGYKFVLTNELLDSTGNSLPGTKVKWTSNDTSVAKIATNSKTKVTTVTALKAGQVTLTCTSLDIYKKQIQVTLVIRDYQPRLQSNVYTINNNSTISQPLNIFASYGNQVQGATIYAKVGKVYSDTTKFTVNPDMTFKADPSLKNGSYPVQIVVTTTAGKRTYTYNATIKVVRTLPATTVKFTGNYNVFTDTDNALTTIYDHKQETPTNYALDTNLALYWDINPTTGEITKNSTPFPNNKPVVSGKVTITYDDYNLPVVKGIKIPVVSTKPSYVLSRTSTTLYNQNSNTITLQLLDSKTKEVIDLSGMTITLGTKSINGATITNDGTTITVTDTNMISGNVIINVQDPSWITSINYTHKVVVSKTIAKASLSKTTLSLNSQVTGQTDSATVKLNQTNVELSATGTLTAKKPSVETAKLSVVYSNGEISAKVTDPSIKAGTYPFVLPVFDDSGNALNTLTINVKVTTAMPKLSAKVTGYINPIDRDNGYVTTTISYVYTTDTLNSVSLDTASQSLFTASIVNNKVVIKALPNVELVNGKVYPITLTVTGNEYTTPLVATIKVKVVQSLPKLKVTNPTLTMYSSVNKADDVVGASLISITNKPGAQIESVTPMYNATLQKAFKYTFSQTSTGGIIQVTIKDPSKIKASSTSALKFKITYVDMATNTKTYSYVTIKVVDRTYKINALVKK